MSMCAPFWKPHDWAPWIATKRVELLTQRSGYGVPVGEPYKTGERIYQERQCRRCGWKQIRTLDT
jgi:hypothetical protein